MSRGRCSTSSSRARGRSTVGESPSWLRHRILIPAFEGSNPSSPAIHSAGSCRAAICPSRSRRMAFDDLMVFTGNANPKLAQEVVEASQHPARQGDGRRVLRRRGDGRAPRERARQGRLRPAVDLRADQRQPDGADDHGRCAEARVGRRASPRRSRTSATRGRTAARVRRACRSRRRSWRTCSTSGGRGPRADDGPARRPDPGLLRHPGGQHLRDADPAGRPVEARTTRTWWWCRRTWAAWCARGRIAKRLESRPRDHRQAAPAAERRRGDEHHRRRRRAAPA